MLSLLPFGLIVTILGVWIFSRAIMDDRPDYGVPGLVVACMGLLLVYL